MPKKFQQSLVLFVCFISLFSCVGVNKKNKSINPLLNLWLPFTSERVRQVYDHSLIRSHRFRSDCGMTCPDIDVWQYQYLRDGELHISDKPISSRRQFWKNYSEARVIAISLFGGKEFYFNALLQYLESFKFIKQANGISDDIWGYETFTVRVYVPKRNPKYLEELGAIRGEMPDHMLDMLLSLGCEIAYTDNKLDETKKDATFWRFFVTQEQMPEGQRIRYLLRDADNILTGVELYSVAQWINSGKRYHRMHVMPICIGPLTAMLWGGTHEGRGDFNDFHDLVKNYPYRFEYGDDELFSRDLLWPRIKASGSVLTHHFKRKHQVLSLASPYKNSCEEPTQRFCLELNQHSQCEDRILPESKTLRGAVESLGMRMSLTELAKTHPEFFDLELEKEERKFIYESLRKDKSL